MSTPWQKLEEDEIAVAHLSDLHFGSNEAQNVWPKAKTFLQQVVKPSLVLVTGDLVDTPKRRWYRKAKEELDDLLVDYYVCAGNHDRYAKGNKSRLFSWLWRPAPNSLFDQLFLGKILLPDAPVTVQLGDGPKSWSLGLLGTDSSLNADAWARGHVDEGIFDQVRASTKGTTWDLCIFLVHHHLLSIRNLEIKRRGSRKDLLNLTCLVNSGSLLETLCEANVDLVLHGHEHEPNWAAYGSFTKGCGQVRVVSAGSVTGNDSFEGCSLGRATFNVIVFSPDRSSRLRRLKYGANNWQIEDEIPLFDPASVRHSWLRRSRADDPPIEISSEITKHVEFTRERHIEVYSVFSNWPPVDEFKWSVYNSTGQLSEVEVRLTAYGRDRVELPPIKPTKGTDHAWDIRFDVPLTHRKVPLYIEMAYTWYGGGVLTDAEMEHIQTSSAPGVVREEGLEFATILSRQPVAAAELIVGIPREYVPQHTELRVLEGETYHPHEAAELHPFLRPLAEGRYAFRVPYPKVGRSYILAWKPISECESPAGVEYPGFRAAAVARGQSLLQTFASAFSGTEFEKRVTFALYLKGQERLILDRLAFCSPAANLNAADFAPPSVSLAKDESGLAKAWWGAPLLATPKDRSRASGFHKDECAIACVPIRFGFEWTNPSPWGVVRMGIMGRADDGLLENQDRLWKLLSLASVKMLTVALDGASVS